MNAKKWVFVVWMAMTVQSVLGQGFKLLEFRGVTQLRQGQIEDAMVDLNRCCDQGRSTCCRWKKTP